jgi:uncharacterized repeat protein (TIGR03803 family)
MKNKSLTWFASTMALVFAITLAILSNAASARAGETVIYSFDKTKGSIPLSGLTSDAAGNLYGTTSGGGERNCGTVFELSNSGGKWTETVLYSFKGCYFVTQTPRGTMVFDGAGNLYGVQQGYEDSGQIFELSKGADGKWSFTGIHSFGRKEGSPNPDLTFDSAGNLYGTTALDSTGFDGEAFELSPQPDGSWKETVLYSFPAPNGVGYPVGGPVFDAKGNIYGAAYYGANGEFGAVYELSPQPKGPWTLTVVYNFTSATSGGPYSKLTFDKSGNLYGTAYQAGPLFLGEVFRLTPTSGGGQWTETTIHTFNSGSDGRYPQGTLVFDASGNLYGTTLFGGLGCNQSLCGTAYKLTPQSGGTWKETILHQFESAGDGSEPQAGLFLDSAGNLYGTTSVGGGRYGYGTVFEITP